MKVELRNVKINKAMSEETECFSANLFIDGKQVATVCNRGQGGADEYHWTDRTMREPFETYCASFTPVVHEGITLTMDHELFVADLLVKWQIEQQARRLCKKNTLFRLNGDGPDGFRQIKEPF